MKFSDRTEWGVVRSRDFSSLARIALGDCEPGPSDEFIGLEHCRKKVHSKLGEDVTKVFTHESWPRIKSVATKLLDRKDFSGTFRNVDRESYIYGKTAEFVQLVRVGAADGFFFPVTPHQVDSYLAWKVSEVLGVPGFFLQPCSIAPLQFPKVRLGEEFPIPVSLPVADSAIVNAALEHGVVRLGSQSQPNYMRIQREQDSASQTPHKVIRIFRSARFLTRLRFPEAVDFSGWGKVNRLFRSAFQAGSIYLTQRALSQAHDQAIFAQRSRFGFREPKPGDYLYALHYEPERTSTPEGGNHLSQFETLIEISGLLPAGRQLWVKEHYSQFSGSLRGFLARSPHFYQSLELFDKIRFLPRDYDLRASSGVWALTFTLTGSVALENSFRGLKTGYFGNPWWSGLPGTRKINNESDVRALEKSNPPTQSELDGFFEKISKGSLYGVGAETQQNARKLFPEIQENYRELEVSALTRLLSDFFG